MMISMYALQGAVQLGLAYGLMAIGLFISYRIVNVADLTVDGSFTLGAAVCAMLTAAGHPVIGFLGAMTAGACAGFVTGFLQTKLHIQPILAGILVMTGLYSVNLHIMGGKPNVPLLGTKTVFTGAASLMGEETAKVVISLLFVVCVSILVIWFFKTQVGLTIRATGDNEDMVRSSSINSDITKMIGLGIANAIVSISGAVICQMQMFADANMGIGMVVIGLASIIIGEVLFGKSSIQRSVAAVVCGSIVYRIIIALVLEFGLPQSDLKLISSVIVIIAISYPIIIKGWKMRKLKKEGESHAEN